MITALSLFLLFQLGYHTIIIVGGYGFQLFDPATLAIIRDGLRLLFCAIIFLSAWKHRKTYLQKRRKLWIGTLLLIGFGVLLSYFFFDKSLNEILIGIKYGLRYLVILLTASWIGYFLQQKGKKLIPPLSWLQRGLMGIVILGRIRQLGKLLFPDFFFSIGYGKLDDFHFGSKPPLYYLTGFEGSLRRQGIFSGPNNYGYFLVLLFPLILKLFPLKNSIRLKQRKKADRINAGAVFLWTFTLLATLSRSAMIGATIVLLIFSFSFLRKHKKTARMILIFLLLGMVGLSALKRESTLAHLQAKFGGIQQVIQAPLGYGLGTSGPAVHHNGKLLPENYYLQLMLDLGSVGFLMRCGILFLLFQEQQKLRKNLISNGQIKSEEVQIFLSLQQGLLAFLVMGMFLHIFEDSMVNYLFFIPYGVLWGALSALSNKRTLDIK